MEIHIPELEDLKNEIIKIRELINTKPVLWLFTLSGATSVIIMMETA